MKKNSAPESSPSPKSGNLLQILQARFEQHMHRHPGIAWAKVQAKLEGRADKLRSLDAMETTGGEPDVVGYDEKADEYLFFDCSPEAPAGRRSVCYDREALDSRKDHPPQESAVEMAAAMGIRLLTEEQYLDLQKLGDFDTKTSSWIETPAAFRELGGALFGDRRYGRVFVYQNSAPCYYRVRGFRGWLRV